MQRKRRALWRFGGVLVFALLAWGRLAGQAAATDPTDPHDPYRLPVVQAACGDEGGNPPQAVVSSTGGHSGESPLEPGMARVYVITETRAIFGSRGAPVRLGMDGKWFGANASSVYGYTSVDVSPGVHHLCVAASVKGVLPHTSAGVLLARVDARAGQTYFFYNLRIQLARIFTLRQIAADDVPMYLQALPSTKPSHLSRTAAAQAACGADPDHMPPGPIPPPNLPGPPTAGQALVYFFSGVPHFGSHGLISMPIHVGMDGQWVGETQFRSYVALQIAPGEHLLCSSTKPYSIVMSSLNLGRLDAVAGKTYFIDTATLQPVEDGLAVNWLRRIAAMPKSVAPDLKALKKWMSTDFPASQAELRECGIPDPGSSEPVPTATAAVSGSPPGPQLFFLLKSNAKLKRSEAMNLGLDGRWVASLRQTSWTSVPLSEGRHRACIHIEPRTSRGVLYLSLSSSLALFSTDNADGSNLYFSSFYVSDESGTRVGSVPLDPDEGQLLVASYPNAATLHR